MGGFRLSGLGTPRERIEGAFREDGGGPYGSTSARAVEGGTDLPTDERHTLWIADFMAEVEIGVERFKEDPDLRHELARLIAEVKAFDRNGGDGYVEDIRVTATGTDAFAQLDAAKARLLRRLEEIADEYATVENVAQPGPQIRWMGNIMELAELVHILETKGWIEGGRSRSKLAEQIAAVLEARDGQPLKLPTLKTYLGIRYIRTPREGVEFNISKNPDKT
ncbi:MAG TPA: hypothetical protein PKD45_15420 [Flavobacteriales bacterium]|nr:hypothetical protein [Flavobacteriales bacterium]